MILLPLLAFVGLSLLIYLRTRPASGFRESALAAGLLLGFFTGLSTELLGFFDALTAPALRALWGGGVGVLALALSRYRASGPVLARQLRQSGRAAFRALGWPTALVLGTLLGLMAVVALCSAPNNADSLSYHLSRLLYWSQQQNVSHYASHSERATSFPPFASFIHLHLYLLTGSFRWFQLVSWSALVAALAAVSLVVPMFSKTPAALRLTLLVLATTPMTALEAMTTQNDVLVGCWALLFVYFAGQYLRQPGWWYGLLATLSVALGVATKTTFVFFVLPLALGWIGGVGYRRGRGSFGRVAGQIALLVVLLNAPFWARNYALYQTPLGHFAGGNKTRLHTLPALVSSTAKHTAMHLGILTPGDRYNAWLRARLHQLHRGLGLALDDDRLGMPFKLVKLNFSEDFAHNFLIAWLGIGAVLLLFRRPVPARLRWYAGGVGAGFLLFCALIGYQWYGARLHTPAFMLAAPVLGIAYGTLPGRVWRVGLPVVLTLGVVPYLLFSTARPLVSTAWLVDRVVPVFNEHLRLGLHTDGLLGLKRPSILTDSTEHELWDERTAESLALRGYLVADSVRTVGFHFREGTADFAYQHLLRNLNLTCRHVLVANYSSPLEDPTFYPDCIVSETRRDSLLWCRRKPYVRTWSGRWCALYVPMGQGAPLGRGLVLTPSTDSLSVQASVPR
jgi:hypothetical protein